MIKEGKQKQSWGDKFLRGSGRGHVALLTYLLTSSFVYNFLLSALCCRNGSKSDWFESEVTWLARTNCVAGRHKSVALSQWITGSRCDVPVQQCHAWERIFSGSGPQLLALTAASMQENCQPEEKHLLGKVYEVTMQPTMTYFNTQCTSYCFALPTAHLLLTSHKHSQSSLHLQRRNSSSCY